MAQKGKRRVRISARRRLTEAEYGGGGAEAGRAVMKPLDLGGGGKV